jgi:hypothetical protein
MQTVSNQMKPGSLTTRSHKQTATEVTMSLGPLQERLAMLQAVPRILERAMIVRKRIGNER